MVLTKAMHYIKNKGYISSKNIRPIIGILLVTLLFWGVTSCLTPSETHLKNAAEAISQGDYDKAVIEFTKLIEIDPDNADHYYARGSCYYHIEQYDLAISDVNMAIELGDNRLDLDYDLRGSSYFAMGDYDTAISDLTKAIEIYKNPLYYNDRGLVYHEKGDYNMAIEDFSIAINISPQDPRLYSSRADTYIATGQESLAIADLKKTLEFADDDSELIQTTQDRLKSLGITDYEINT